MIDIIGKAWMEHYVQDVQIEENKNALAQASQVSVVQENAEREEKLLSALSEAQSSLSNLQKLHEASQKQLFNLQTRDEEERVSSCFGKPEEWI